MKLLGGALLALSLVSAHPVAAQASAQFWAATISPALQARIDDLPAILNGTADYDAYFAPLFKATVPKPQFTQLTARIAAQVGPAVKVEHVTPVSPNAANLRIAFARGIASAWIAVDRASPHAVTGLRITDVAPRGDSFLAIEAELRALPGTTALAIHALGDDLRPIHSYGADAPLPIGSGFKLWVLAEAARQVRVGMRRWSDVIPLGPRSLPSGATQAWPPNAPVTLHTLATLMISISDNTASDTLMATLGRDRVEAMAATAGVTALQALPLLTTIEALRLKAPANADLAARWSKADPAERRRLLRDNAARLAATRVDEAMFGDRPLALDVEWFASPSDIARTLDWLRVSGGDQALAMLAITPGTSSAALFDYVGYKGGSEPGVIFGAWLVRTRQGNWYTVTGGWTNPASRIDDAGFAALMGRALTQLAAR